MNDCRSGARDRAVAALATLHVGVEPVMLALLAEGGAIRLEAGGWVVGAGQIGMSAGAMLAWRSPAAARRPAAVAAAIIGAGTSLAFAGARGLTAVLLLRVILGVAMGILLACSTARAARNRPHRAIGIILLSQQLLATLVMLALPPLAAWCGPRGALSWLALVPLGVLALTRNDVHHSVRDDALSAVSRPAGVQPMTVMAMAALLGVTLMVWSYVEPTGALAGLDTHATTVVIAATSLASAPAASLASFAAPRNAPWLVALTCGVAILAPLLLPRGSGLPAYVAALILFNAASTFATIRFSAWAMAACDSERRQRAVVVAQCVATAAGGPLAALAVAAGGLVGLTALAIFGVALAVLAPLVAQRSVGRPSVLARA